MADIRKAGAEILRLIQSSVDPALEAGRVLLYGKLSGGATKLFMRDSAGTIAEVGAGGIAPSISILTNQVQTAGDLTTFGTIDWLHLLGINNSPPILFGASVHAKAKGGWLRSSFTWVLSPGSVWVGAGGSTVTASANDSQFNQALSTTDIRGPQNFGGTAGMGWSFSVPAGTVPREVRFYHGQSGHARVTATIDGLTVDAVDTAGGGETRIVYSGVGPLNVTVRQENTSGTTTIWIAYVLLRDA